MEIDLSESRQPAVIAENTVMAVLALTAVALRFYARKLAGAEYWWDDWCTLIALPCSLFVSIITAEFVDVGLGKHQQALPDGPESYEHQLYFELLFYTLGLALFKYALLLLYVRVFPQLWLRVTAWSLGAAITAWLIAVEFVSIFQCTPIRRSWDQDVPGTCLSQQTLFLSQSIPTIFFDVIILVLPIPLMWHVQMRWSQKIAIYAVFATGGMVTVISCVRLAETLHTVYGDVTWNFVNLALWSDSEAPIGLVSACLPTYGIFLKKIGQRLNYSWMPKSYESRAGSNGLYRLGSANGNGGYEATAHGLATVDSTERLAGHSGDNPIASRSDDISMTAIYVKTDVNVAHEARRTDFTA